MILPSNSGKHSDMTFSLFRGILTISEFTVSFITAWFFLGEALRLHMFLSTYSIVCLQVLRKLVCQMEQLLDQRNILTQSHLMVYRKYEIIVRICNNCICFVGYVYFMGSIGLCAYANYILISRNEVLPWWLIGTIVLCTFVGILGTLFALDFADTVAEKCDLLRHRFKCLVISVSNRKLFLCKLRSLRDINLTMGFHELRFMQVDKETKSDFLTSVVEHTANALLV